MHVTSTSTRPCLVTGFILHSRVFWAAIRTYFQDRASTVKNTCLTIFRRAYKLGLQPMVKSAMAIYGAKREMLFLYRDFSDQLGSAP
jgi:hypothetical protein